MDCNAGWIAGGAVSPGDMQLNLGTCGVLGVVHQSMDYLSNPDGLRMVNIPYTTSPADTFSAVAVTTTGGQALRYLRDTFGNVEVDVERLLKVSSYDLLTLQARDVPPGSEGLLVLPYLMGERSPIWDSAARGVVFGLSLHHGRGHLVRAFMEGVAYALFDSYSVLRRTGLQASHPLIFNEGGPRARSGGGSSPTSSGSPPQGCRAVPEHHWATQSSRASGSACSMTSASPGSGLATASISSRTSAITTGISSTSRCIRTSTGT